MRIYYSLSLLLISLPMFSQLHDSGNNVGIGTTNPLAKLHVNNGDNSYGTILANASETPFSLYAKTLTTNQSSIEVFRLGLKYDSNEDNGFVSFYRGASGTGGFLGFSTFGIERLRILGNGNIGIGTNSPRGLLDIQRTAENNGGQSVVNITGSTWSGDGASLIFNQVWNDNYYKTIIDNNGGSFNQVGSGLKIQTSYWDGSKVNIITALSLSPLGNLGIGTLTTGTHKLAVDGSIGAREIKVETTTWPDYVFKKEYSLPTLTEVEKHIIEKGHLKDIPTQEEALKNGINLGEMNAKLLQKIEELTLYTIQQEKELKSQSNKIIELEIQNTIFKDISNRLIELQLEVEKIKKNQ